MIVAGGVYREICSSARWDRIFGSGGRAALAVAGWGGSVRLIGYTGRTWIADAVVSFRGAGVTPELIEISDDIEFIYDHPLAFPVMVPRKSCSNPALLAEGDAVLRFGFVEGDVIVTAKAAVFDPQGSNPVGGFRGNGSTAEKFALVLNDGEARAITGQVTSEDAAASLLHDADAVVVKRGALGALVVERGRAPVTVPAYRSQRVFKIGSGDIFSAIFARVWFEGGSDAAEAADVASRAVSVYVESRTLPIRDRDLLRDRTPLPFKLPGQIYIAAPFFTTAELWLVEQLVAGVEALGAKAFSPFHDVGFGGSSSSIANADLRGLDGCDAVLAVLDGRDPGTLFEIGYATKSCIPVVVFSENALPGDLTMFEGSGCTIAGDLSTAVYQAVWAAMR